MIHTEQIRCKTCGSVYTVAIGYPSRAPHGPNKDCTANSWEIVVRDEECSCTCETRGGCYRASCDCSCGECGP